MPDCLLCSPSASTANGGDTGCQVATRCKPGGEKIVFLKALMTASVAAAGLTILTVAYFRLIWRRGKGLLEP
jgi:hypothetical protein